MDDLKLIKKHYGEKMMHLCREIFPTLLETEGLLYTTLIAKFYPSRNIYDDIVVNEDRIDTFKNIIYNAVIEMKQETISNEKTPKELLEEAGYILYECNSEKDIQSFRHYYQRSDGRETPTYIEGTQPEHNNGEELCTFSGGRLNRCYVFFAIKKDAEFIKRKTNPERQDEYGTSVISIQFSKGDLNTLSIKNRYNHTVKNPDATFYNDLDCIIDGLTASFEKEYNLNINSTKKQEYLSGFIKANDERYYRYNFEKYNINYCDNNIIIDNSEVIELDKSRYLVFENYIIDFKEKTIKLYDKEFIKEDSFLEGIQDIESIKVEIDKETKEKNIIINDDIIITLTKTNQIKSYKNSHITEVGDNFLRNSTEIESIDLENIEVLGEDFLHKAAKLTSINIPKCRKIDNGFLYSNKELKSIDLPKVEMILDNFMFSNNILNNINMPNLKTIGDRFLYHNKNLREIDLPNIISIGNNFLCVNKKMNRVNIPNCREIGESFLANEEELESIDLRYVNRVGNCFMPYNEKLNEINLEKCKYIGNLFLRNNNGLESIDLYNTLEIGNDFLLSNKKLKDINIPNVRYIGNKFIESNLELEKINIPNVIKIGERFLFHNRKLNSIDLPNCEEIKDFFLRENQSLESIDLPKLHKCGKYFLFSNKILNKIKADKLINIDDNFLVYNEELESIDFPKIKKIGVDFIPQNQKLKNINIPSIESIDIGFLTMAKNIKEIYMPRLMILFGNRIDFVISNLPFKIVKNKSELSDMFEDGNDGDIDEKSSSERNK